MKKPLLIGMNNPLSDDPEYDLYPYPEGSTGWRLWQMLPGGTTRAQYLAAFDRHNLLRARTWDPKAAKAAAQVLYDPPLRGSNTPSIWDRTVVVLGTQVRSSLGLPPTEPLEPVVTVLTDGRRLSWVPFPHPSGRNRWFSDVHNLTRAREVLTGLMPA